MSNFHDSLTSGDLPATINTVVEIPMGSNMKIEYDAGKGHFVLDRVEPLIFAKPVNYGFIPQTKDEDGDALDTLVVSDMPIPTGVVVKAKIVGLLKFEDDGEMDHKIVCVPEDDRHSRRPISSLEDLGPGWQKQIEHHFNHYKDLKSPGSTKVLGWGDSAEALQVIEACIARAKQ